MKSRKIISTVITTLLVVVVIVLNQIFALKLGERVIDFVSPVGIVVSSTAQNISNFFGNIVNIGSLQAENKDLNSKLDSALVEIARLTEAKKENDSLRADLGFKLSRVLDLVPGDVAYFDPGLKEGITVRVDDISGIKTGNVVLSQGYLIGRVSGIDGHKVKILLITDSTSSLPATLQSKNITGVAKGKIGNGLVLEQVPQSDNVVKGDMVVTSGLGGDIPKGLIIGKVDEIQKVSGSIFQNIIMQPMIEFTHIERVMIAR